MLCYVMLCYVMLCYAMLSYVDTVVTTLQTIEPGSELRTSSQ